MLSKKEVDKLVQDNQKLVHSVAKRYKGLCEYEDLFQEGMIGLIKAVRRFDPLLGYAFSSFAVPYISGEILHYLRDKATIIRAPRGAEKYVTYSLDAPVDSLETPGFFIDSIASPEPEVDENLIDLQDFVSSLPDDAQKLFQLAAKGCTYKFIAAEFRIAPATVTRRIAKLITSARLFFETIPSSLSSVIDKIETEAIKSTETVFQKLPQKVASIWDNLKDDIFVAFQAYREKPSIRSIDRCLESLYLFGLEAIKSKYFYLGGSAESSSLISWEDLLHESICKVRQYLLNNQINSDSHLIAMLYTFAKYACWHEMRRAAKYTSLNKPVKSTETATLEDFISSTLSEQTPERLEDLKIIESALNRLPIINKRVVELAWIEGKTLTQISQQIEKPLNFVSQIIQKSRITIARELTGRRMSLGY